MLHASRLWPLLLLVTSCVIRDQPPPSYVGPRPAPYPSAPSGQAGPSDFPMTPEPSAPSGPTAPTAPASPGFAATHGCTRDYYRHQPAALAALGPELHYIGIHVGADVIGEHGVEPTSRVKVTVDRPGKEVVLMLAAYNRIEWQITATPGTRLRRALLSGYHQQLARAPAGTQVESFSYDERKPFVNGAYSSYHWPSVEGELITTAAQARTQLPLASVRGCYQSSHFTISDEPATAPPSAAEGLLARCGHVLKEQRRCVATAAAGENHLVAIGLDSGTACIGPVLHGSEGHGQSSLGWIGDYVYTCERERGIVEVSLRDGAIRVAPFACESVTNDGQSLIVTPAMQAFGGAVERYASFDALLARQPLGTLKIAGTSSRLAVQGNAAYTAGHSTDEIGVTALDSGQRTTIKLDRYDDWIFGLDVLSNGNILVGSPRRTERDLRVFDGRTGAQLKSYKLELGHADIAGFKCREGA